MTKGATKGIIDRPAPCTLKYITCWEMEGAGQRNLGDRGGDLGIACVFERHSFQLGGAPRVLFGWTGKEHLYYIPL